MVAAWGTGGGDRECQGEGRHVRASGRPGEKEPDVYMHSNAGLGWPVRP